MPHYEVGKRFGMPLNMGSTASHFFFAVFFILAAATPDPRPFVYILAAIAAIHFAARVLVHLGIQAPCSALEFLRSFFD